MLPFIAIGFLAQLVDGSLGMAFGAISTTLLVGFMGMAPAQASYEVHIIKILTSRVSGIRHLALGNIQKRLFVMILLSGILGGPL